MCFPNNPNESCTDSMERVIEFVELTLARLLKLSTINVPYFL